MFNLSKFRTRLAATDLDLVQQMLKATLWSYGDYTFLGAAFVRPEEVPLPQSSPVTEIAVATIPNAVSVNRAYLMTGTMMLANESTVPCMVITGPIYGDEYITETLTANLDRLAKVLGYTTTIDDVETPLWVCADKILLHEQSTKSLLTTKEFNIDGSFTNGGAAYCSYSKVTGFDVTHNRSLYSPVNDGELHAVDDGTCAWRTATGTIYVYMTGRQYTNDMQNMQDLSNYLVIAMGNPSETSDLTARVSALETTVATEVSTPVAAAITNAVSVEASLRDASVSDLALAVSNIPVFGARLVDVAAAASTVREYVPRT